MMSPTAPLVNRQLVWHLYSAQAYGIFHGDLDMYFGYEHDGESFGCIESMLIQLQCVEPCPERRFYLRETRAHVACTGQ